MTDPATPLPTVVLVHGAWADASSWNGVIPRLAAAGHTVLAPPNQLRSAGNEPSGPPAYESIPSWFLIGTEDRIITPTSQHEMAKRANSTVVETDVSHVSLISKPDDVASLVLTAARATS